MALFSFNHSRTGRQHSLHPGLTWQLVSIPIIGLFLLPLLALLFETTPAEVFSNLKNPTVQDAIWLSAKTSLLTTLFVVVLGTPLALIIARRKFLTRNFLDSLIDLPMVLPPAVAGVALLMAFGRRGLLGEPLGILGLEIPFTELAVILAQMFVAGPLYLRAAIIGFESIDRNMIDAAVIDGADTWQVLLFIALPHTRKALVGGAVLTWARALGEFGATIIFAGNLAGKTQTMPLAIFIGFEMDLDIAITLSVLMMGISFAVLLIVKFLMGR